MKLITAIIKPAKLEEVREGLKGNMCRCTGYQGIVDAVMAYAQTAQEQPAGDADDMGGAATEEDR